MAINVVLAVVKISAGLLGHANVLVADGIESTLDVAGSLIVMVSLRYSSLPADENHPFGHGKAETIASGIVALALLNAAGLIAVRSIIELQSPQPTPPALYTLPLLVGIIVVTEMLFRKALRVGGELGSSALVNDAWHHRADVLTSVAAFLGILVALVGGRGFEQADDWAALLACGVIAWNGLRLLGSAVNEVMDASVPPDTVRQVREIAGAVEGVITVEKCRVRKAGRHLSLDIHVVVDGNLNVRRAHAISHHVKDCLIAAPLRINDVTVHIEPDSW